jgi:uncharacterized protein YegL
MFVSEYYLVNGSLYYWPGYGDGVYPLEDPVGKKGKKRGRIMAELVPPVQKNDGRILINIVADMSGSMSHLADDTRGTINGFIKDQVDQEGEAFVTLINFDTTVETPFTAILAADAPEITREIYTPRGGTALLDAIGEAIRSTEKVIVNLRPEQVLFVIITDGEENSSREWKLPDVAALIKEKQEDPEDPWQFTFVGANVDEWNDAYRMGGATFASNSLGFEASNAGMLTLSGTMVASTRAYRTSKQKIVTNYFTQPTKD